MTSLITWLNCAVMFGTIIMFGSMGEILSQYPRESFYLASKMPGFGPEHWENKEEIFETQLKKCRVEYFDFYLFHCVFEDNIDGFLDPKYGIVEYLIRQKEAGRIHHLGFSCHGKLPTLKRFPRTISTLCRSSSTGWTGNCRMPRARWR